MCAIEDRMLIRSVANHLLGHLSLRWFEAGTYSPLVTRDSTAFLGTRTVSWLLASTARTALEYRVAGVRK